MKAGTQLGSYPRPTTFQTSVSSKPWHESRAGPNDLASTLAVERPLPSNSNYPWGGDSPMHRHENVTELNNGVARVGVEAGGLSWAKVLDKLKRLWL